MKVLSVVCARAGSKGLKNKCMTKIGGRMVIEYSIDYSIALGGHVKTVVSTDIDELIEHCKKIGVRYIRRAPELCTDEARIDSALADAIEKEGGEECEFCSVVYGNIPTRYPALFHKALKFLEDNHDYDAVLTMQNVEKFHPDWMFEYDEEVLPQEEKGHYRRQELPRKMIHDGHTLLFKSQGFYKNYKDISHYDKKIGYSIYGKKIKPLITQDVIIDIDTEKDLRMAEALIFYGMDKIARR